MLPSWWFSFMLVPVGLRLAYIVGIPFVGTILVVLATAPTWRKIAGHLNADEKDQKKWRAPTNHVSASQLKEFAYKNEKLYLLDRLDKHNAAKAVGKNHQPARLAAGFVVTLIINAVVGYSGHATSEDLQGLIQIAAALFGLLVLGLLAQLFQSRLDPDWIYCPQLYEENERKRQEGEEQQARFERDARNRWSYD